MDVPSLQYEYSNLYGPGPSRLVSVSSQSIIYGFMDHLLHYSIRV